MEKPIADDLKVPDDITPIGPQPAPREFAEKVNWLADRAEISDLMVSFARSLDSRDELACQALFADEGCLEIGEKRICKADIPAFVQNALFAAVPVMQDTFTNQQMWVSGDTATGRVYFHGLHVIGSPENPFEPHHEGYGWYDCKYVRTGVGWRLFSVKIAQVWAGPSK